MKILDTINNVVGTFISAAMDVPINTSSFTVSATMTKSEIGDSTDTLRIGIEADFGAGFRHMIWGGYWTGGDNQVAPSVTWQFNPKSPPKQTRAVLENRTQVIVGLVGTFN